MYSNISTLILPLSQTRKAIMGDIELTPSLGLACHTDVNTQCAAVPKNLEGGVINCLMQLASLVATNRLFGCFLTNEYM